VHFFMLSLALGGCWSVQSRSGAAGDGALTGRVDAQPLPPDAWPPRDIAVAQRLHDATPMGVVQAAERGPRGERHPERVVIYKGMHGLAVLRQITGKPATERDDVAFANNDAEELLMVSSRTLDNDAFRLQAALAESGLESAKIGALMLDAGVRMRMPARRDDYRLLVYHFTSLVDNPWEREVLARWKERGWAIVDIETQTRVQPPVSRKAREMERALGLAAIDVLRDPEAAGDPTPVGAPGALTRRIEARAGVTYEALRREVASSAFDVADFGGPAEAGRAIAAAVDQSLAGNAYALESAVDYVRSRRRDLADLPVAVVGFSAGGLATPGAVVRCRESVGSAVIIGSGVDLFMLSQNSSLTDGGLKLRWGGRRLSGRERSYLHAEYIEATRLDPIRTAPLMSGLPVLLIHATRDEWVPARGGELLINALPGAEVWRFNGGHLRLFMSLPDRADAIADWVERNTPPAAGGG